MDNILIKSLRQLDIETDSIQIQQLKDFYNILIEWNKFMNLTGITSYEEVVKKHFLDSLAIVKVQDISEINKIIDIGTGAGFPGIPLKIIYPHLDITLLDSLKKRIKFLNVVVNELKLKNVNLIHGRAEDYARQESYREKYELCVSRAVANLSTLSEYCLPYIKIDGVFIPYKSGDIENEITKSKKAVKLLGGKIKSVTKFQLPGTDINRSFVLIKKIETTNKIYPRKAGIPTKEPL